MDAINTTGTTPDAFRYVFLQRPRCPVCESAELKTLRTNQVDGVTSRRTECRECRHKFFVIVE